MRTLCFNLDVNYEDLPTVGRVHKARELISYLERRGRIPELVQMGEQLRPNLSWGDAIQPTSPTASTFRSPQLDPNLIEFLDKLPCPVLATSRIRPSGSQVIELSSLPPDDAVQLFRQVSELEPDDLDESVADLCAKDLEGHPLAIEVVGALAAAGLDVKELRSALREMPLDVLSETAVAAGRSVVDALQLSYQRLGPLAQTLLARMSIFPTDFDLGALATLSPEHPRLHQVKGLRELLDRSLLTQTSRQRYRLHPVTRQFAYALLADPEIFHRRAGAYFMTEAGSDSLAAVGQFLRAGDEPEAAAIAPQHVEAWMHAGRASEALAVCQDFTLESLAPVERTNIYQARGGLHYLLGELDAAVGQYERAIENAEQASVDLRVQLHRELADVLTRKGEYDDALACLARGRDLLADRGDTAVENGRIAVGYGTALLALSRYDEALVEAQTALNELGETSAVPRIAADLHDLIGKVYFFRGAFADSLEQFRAALALRENDADRQGIIKSYSNLAVVYGEQNRYAEARQANESALEVAEQIDDAVALNVLYANMAGDYTEQGAYDQAIDFYEHSLALCTKMGNVHGLAVAHRNVGQVYRHLEQLDLSREHLTQAIELARQVDHQHGIIGGLKELAEVYLAQNRTEKALAHCLESLGVVDRVNNQFWRPESLDLLGRIHHVRGQWNEARIAFGEACQIWRERETLIDLSGTLLNWARQERDAGQADRARELGAEAAALAGKEGADALQNKALSFLLKLEPDNIAPEVEK